METGGSFTCYAKSPAPFILFYFEAVSNLENSFRTGMMNVLSSQLAHSLIFNTGAFLLPFLALPLAPLSSLLPSVNALIYHSFTPEYLIVNLQYSYNTIRTLISLWISVFPRLSCLMS